MYWYSEKNVKLAAQLLSHKVTTALQRYKPCTDACNTEDLAMFIDACNSWFDLINMYIPKMDAQPSKCRYGLREKEQNAILDTMYEIIFKMSCCSKCAMMKQVDADKTAKKKEKQEIKYSSLKLFQKGILMSLNSLKGLLSHVKTSTT